MPAVASSAPAVLIAHLAQATTTLRVGSGGVMLPNHSPLVVAEQFRTLEALHPGGSTSDWAGRPEQTRSLLVPFDAPKHLAGMRPTRFPTTSSS